MQADRTTARQLAQDYIAQGDPLGWFEALYAAAAAGEGVIPWADRTPNPHLITWLQTRPIESIGKTALKVGCGLGDDVEALADCGLDTVGFDISPTAIALCHHRFPHTPARYVTADLFQAPTLWNQAFDLVLESYTLQVLPPALRPEAMAIIANFVAPGGMLLVICRGRNPTDPPGQMPWSLTQAEILSGTTTGLSLVKFEDFIDAEDPPIRRFRVTFKNQHKFQKH